MKYYYVLSEGMLMAIIRTEDDFIMEESGPWALEEDCENYFARMAKYYLDQEERG